MFWHSSYWTLLMKTSLAKHVVGAESLSVIEHDIINALYIEISWIRSVSLWECTYINSGMESMDYWND